MSFYENFVRLCNKAGKSPSAVALEIGIQKPTVTRWSNGSTPRDATLIKVADYFGISTQELIGETKKAPAEDGERTVTEEDIKAAFWGGEDDLPEDAIAELWEDAKSYIAFKTEQAKKRRK